MWNNADELKGMLKHLEKLKVGVMKEINRLNGNKDAVIPTTVFPMAKVKPLIIKEFPVFQFSYEGMLPHFKENDNEYLMMIKDYYFRATFDAYDFEQIYYRFPETVIIYVQYFKDKIIRDLDNRNKKYIQDAIRHTSIIGDDNWQSVWTMDLGFKDKEDHVQVYVVSRDNFHEFYLYLLDNHEEMKSFSENYPSKEEMFLEYQAKMKLKNDGTKNKIRKNNSSRFINKK